MNDDRFERTIDELEKHACKWWPRSIRDAEQETTILPILLETQDKFISLLKLTDINKPLKLFALIEASSLSYPLFLKHLIVLTDFGSEPLQRINNNFIEIFPDLKFVYDVGEGVYEYTFTSLPVRGTLSNKKMRIDTKESLSINPKNTGIYKDLIILLLYGGAAVGVRAQGVFFKCTPYQYLGNATKIEDFVRKNYLRVSRIIGGSTATTLGNLAQQYIVIYLLNALGDDYNVHSNGTIPGVTQNDGSTLTSFDVVVDRKKDTSRHKKYVAIEVTFQETTNSTIERKGGQARNRFETITNSRNYIAYIVDGAGNFARRAAISVICENSHCTVAYTDAEFNLLVEFIREKIG